MYTLKLLAPVLVSLCVNEATTGQGDYCVLDQPQSNVVKYYEPNKSCYVNGVFYSKCSDRLEQIVEDYRKAQIQRQKNISNQNTNV